MNERIRQVREALCLSQISFAEKLNLQRNSISRIETGSRNPSTRTVNDICNEFNVNEDWLRTGIGEMFNEKPTDLEDLIKKENLSSTAEQLVRIILDLKEDTRQDLIATLKKHIGDTDVVSGFIEEFTELYNKKSHEDS